MEHVDRIAREYGLPEDIVRAIIQVESAGNTWAMRYEPVFLVKYVPANPERFGASVATERIGRATSWGLMQIIGQTAREMGFRGAYFTELCQPDTGIEFGCKYMAKLQKKYQNLEEMIVSYNAGSPRKHPDGIWVNQEYLDRVTAARLQTT